VNKNGSNLTKTRRGKRAKLDKPYIFNVFLKKESYFDFHEPTNQNLFFMKCAGAILLL